MDNSELKQEKSYSPFLQGVLGCDFFVSEGARAGDLHDSAGCIMEAVSGILCAVATDSSEEGRLTNDEISKMMFGAFYLNEMARGLYSQAYAKHKSGKNIKRGGIDN